MEDDLKQAVAEVLHREQTAVDPEEFRERMALVVALFQRYQPTKLNRQMAAEYVEDTVDVPMVFLRVAFKAIRQAHVYPSVPSVADIRKAAKIAAGMERGQYRAGHYLPPPREWPPAGKRHSIHFGCFEPVNDQAMLTAGTVARLELESGE